ncbi:MAG: ribonuclease domain-containing protein [Eubacteriales bacterium]|nr:ribonuclease domain-containing protein [Eubacteriales bacterium]
MKKRTKIELVIFALVACFYLFTLFTESRDKNTEETSAAVETELQTKDIDKSFAGQLISGGGEDSNTKPSSGITDTGSENAPALQQNIAETNSNVSQSGIGSASLETELAEDGSYTDKEQVALYIATYGQLPHNYITKNEAKAAGWDAETGNLDAVCPGKSIGGDRFGNYEGNLPDKKGRKYFECDINYNKDDEYRGAERIIYSNDGLIYYTGDHYKTFELLYDNGEKV